MFFLPQVPPPNEQRWALYAHHLGDYMRRWILRTPWGTLRLHNILRSDEDRHLHDHPFDFTSLLLTGGYDEVTPKHFHASQLVKSWPRFSIVRKRAEESHRLIVHKPLWTLVVSGPKRRSWGFHTEQGWIHHRDYLKAFPAIASMNLASHADLKRIAQ